MRHLLYLLALGCLMFVTPGFAVAQNGPQQYQALPGLNLSFTQVNQATLAVTTTSARVAFPASGGSPTNYDYVCNTGTSVAWVAYGGANVVAVAGQGQGISPNQCLYPSMNPVPTYIAGVTSAGTASLVILVGVVTQPQLGNFDLNNLITLTAAGISTVNSQDQINFNGVGANCFMNVTATGGSPAYVFAIQGKDTTSGTYYDVVRSSPAATNGNSIIATTFPGQPISLQTNIARESFPLPRTWRVQVVITGGTVTATVGCSVLF